MTRDEKIIEVVGTVSSLTPLVGGPLSSILMGISGDRRFDRVRKVIIDLAERLGDVEADREAFVRSENFEDLLIETLQRVAAERASARLTGTYCSMLSTTPGSPTTRRCGSSASRSSSSPITSRCSARTTRNRRSRPR
jgi:hypothetical protein